MRKISMIALTTLMLVGCTKTEEQKAIEHKVVGQFNNVLVINKIETGHQRGIENKYYIVVEKNGQKVKLQTRGEESYEALNVGNVINIKYSKNFYIEEIYFPKMRVENE